MQETQTQDRARPYAAKVRRGRILLAVLSGGGRLAIFFAVLLIALKTEGTLSWILALVFGLPAALLLQLLTTRLSMKNETSFTSVLTDGLDPELFSSVLRQTRGDRRDLPYLRRSMEITERFYLGEKADVLDLVSKDSQMFSPSQPEFVSYLVQSAVLPRDRDTALAGIGMLKAATDSEPYAKDPSFALSVDLFGHLALSAFCLQEKSFREAREHAEAVYRDRSAAPLQKVYACGYLCLALEGLGRAEEAALYREEVLTYAPSFGIVKEVLASRNE